MIDQGNRTLDERIESRPVTTPYLIIVTGRPGAGKTTLARWLAQELQIPLVSKDSIREVLFERLGWSDRAWAQMLGHAAVDLMFYFAQMQLEVGCSLIIDNAFDSALSSPRFRALKTRYHAETIQIICNADRETLFQRFKARATSADRHPGHGDMDVLEQLRTHLAQAHSPTLEIGGAVVKVDTSDFERLDYQGILKQVLSFMARD